MRITLKVFSIICVVIGGLAILGGIVEPGGGNAYFGGGLLLAEGIIALVYIQGKKPSKPSEKEDIKE